MLLKLYVGRFLVVSWSLHFVFLLLLFGNEREVCMDSVLPMNDALFSPAILALERSRNRRNCKSISDEEWIELGVRRVLSNEKSGHAFLSLLEDKNDREVAVSLFFEALKSKRRLSLCEDVMNELCRILKRDIDAIDPFNSIESLSKYELRAGDGHYLEHACHDKPIDEKKYATGHFFGINMRSHSMFHLDLADQGGTRKKEHDTRLLKRTSVEKLRIGVEPRKPVIWVWDKASIDIAQWQKLQKDKIFFLSRAKENMKLKTIKTLHFDNNDPLNNGIEAFELVEVATRYVTMVRYRHPITKKTYEYITTLMDMEPGAIALLYQARWDIEKTFDETKTKLEEKKSWASSKTAKKMQAIFICITHNLILKLERKIEKEEGVGNDKEQERKENRHNEEKQQAKELNTEMPTIPKAFWKRMTQRCYRFIRWVRNGIDNTKSWTKQLSTLRKHLQRNSG